MSVAIEVTLAEQVRAVFALPSRAEQRRGEQLVLEAARVELPALETHARGRLALTENDVIKLECWRVLRADALAWNDAGRPAGVLLNLAHRALRAERDAQSALRELRACGLGSELIDGTRWFKTSEFANAARKSTRIAAAWLRELPVAPPPALETEQNLDRIDTVVQERILTGLKERMDHAAAWIERTTGRTIRRGEADDRAFDQAFHREAKKLEAAKKIAIRRGRTGEPKRMSAQHVELVLAEIAAKRGWSSSVC